MKPYPVPMSLVALLLAGCVATQPAAPLRPGPATPAHPPGVGAAPPPVPGPPAPGPAPGGSHVPGPDALEVAATSPPPAGVWRMPHCVGYDPGGHPARAHRLGVTVAATTLREVYEPGWAERAMAEIRRLVAACGSYEHGGGGGQPAFREQNAPVDRYFGGDESVLVRTTRVTPGGPVEVWYTAAVRHGDEVITARAGTGDGAACAVAPTICRAEDG